MEVLRMEVESHPWNERFIRITVGNFLARVNPTLEELEDVKTAVSEAVTNAIIHGYDGKEGIIHIVMAWELNHFSIDISDDGVGMEDVKKAMEPMYSGKTEQMRSGMGFCFMEAFMDQLEVTSTLGQGTKVHMEKEFGHDATEEITCSFAGSQER